MLTFECFLESDKLSERAAFYTYSIPLFSSCSIMQFASNFFFRREW